MGLDMTVAQTTKDIDLISMYHIMNVVNDGFDWHLGTDRSRKYDIFHIKSIQISTLTKNDVLEKIQDDDDKKYSHLKNLSDDEFAKYLKYLYNAIGDFHIENSHLFFDYDKLPGDSLLDSCSWGLRDLIYYNCITDTITSSDDSIVEIDKDKLSSLAKKWKRFGRKLKLIKFIWYIYPEMAERMFNDWFDSNCIMEYDINECIYIANQLNELVKKVDKTSRLWLISSY